MRTYWLFYLLILFSTYLLANKLGRDIFRPYSRTQRKRSEDILYYDADDFESFKKLKKDITYKFPVIGMGQAEREIMQKKIERLGLDITVNELRQTQLLYASIVLILGIITSIFVQGLVGFIIMLASIYAWKLPVWKIDDEIKKRNDVVKAELPKLYMVLYYSYRNSPNVNFIDKVQSFMMHTNSLFYQELQLLVNDARQGEVYALREFKKRVPIGIVMRFCDILETRLIGYDNIAVMQNFKQELDEQRSLKEDELLEKTIENMETSLKIGVYLAIGLLLGTYFTAQLLASFRGL